MDIVEGCSILHDEQGAKPGIASDVLYHTGARDVAVHVDAATPPL
jgi:hypothetical protein